MSMGDTRLETVHVAQEWEVGSISRSHPCIGYLVSTRPLTRKHHSPITVKSMLAVESYASRRKIRAESDIWPWEAPDNLPQSCQGLALVSTFEHG